MVESAVSEKPVTKLAAAGLTPMSPVNMEAGTLEMPVLARIRKLPAVPSRTGAGPITGGITVAAVVQLQLKSLAIAMPTTLLAPLLPPLIVAV